MALRRSGAARLFALLALVCGAGAALLGYRVLQQSHRQRQALVAVRAVAPFQAVASADVTARLLPAAAVPADALDVTSQAVGKYVRYGLVPGQVVQRADLALSAAPSAYDAELTALQGQGGGSAPSLRAVPVYLAAHQGFSLLRPGDRVDVMVAEQKSGGGLVQAAARYVRVQAVLGQSAAGTALAGAQAGVSQSGVVILDLTPSETERLLLGEVLGTVTVVLDPLSGVDGSAVPPLTEQEWASQAGLAVPQAPAQGR